MEVTFPDNKHTYKPKKTKKKQHTYMYITTIAQKNEIVYKCLYCVYKSKCVDDKENSSHNKFYL